MPHPTMRWIVLTLAAWMLAVGTPVAQAATPGSPGVGDPYFPLMGDGGYRAQHYTIAMSVDVARDTIAATTTMAARAMQALSAFDLDYAGPPISRVAVNGVATRYTHHAAKLVITPAAPVANGATFTVAVAYAGTPRHQDDPFGGGGWMAGHDEIYVFGEPGGAETWYPVNTHPEDKATYTLQITVPKPYAVAADGTLARTTDNGATRTFLWTTRDPVASYLVGLHIGLLDEVTAVGPHGLPIRNYFAHALPAADRTPFNLLPAMIAYFESVFGPYPFEAYGATVVDASFGAALETQTLSTYSRDAVSEPVVAHELAHQWFGDSVGLRRWQDIWLNEGFATYAQWLWMEHTQGIAARDAQVRFWYAALAARDQLDDPATRARLNAGQLVDLVLTAFPGLLSRQAALAALGVTSAAALARMPASVALPRLHLPPQALQPIKIGDPGPASLFRSAVYYRGALTLHALRLRLGDALFFRTLRTYTARYRYSTATTRDFVAVAEQVSGQNLDAFFAAWLDQTTLPPIPQMGLGTTH